MHAPAWLALDIGGANLKAADGRGYAASRHFPLWQQPQRLADALRAMIAEAPESDHLAVTMTGELADCYRTKTEGVEQILAAVEAAADHRHTRVYLVNGRLVAPPVARGVPLLAAASNWHALATFAGRYAGERPALLIDIGTTTSDIIPLEFGRPSSTAQTDLDRLLAGELVYTGVERSPLCAVLHAVPYRGQVCTVAQELFATTLDAYLVLGELHENAQYKHTADGRPATREFALERLARALCADRTQFGDDDARQMARAVRAAQLQQLRRAAEAVVQRLTAPPENVIVSGRGEFLARRLLAEMQIPAAIVSLRDLLGAEVSRAAPAHALAVLAREGM